MKAFVRNILLGVLLLSSIAGLTSCNGEEIDLQAQARSRSERYFANFADSVQGETNYLRTSIPGILGEDNFVYVKWIKRGTDTIKPKATDKVRYHYQWYTLTGQNNGAEYVLQENLTTEAQVVTPQDIRLLPIGLNIALQNMVVGDEVYVAIPWHLTGTPGSYAAGNDGLFCKITLLGIDG